MKTLDTDLFVKPVHKAGSVASYPAVPLTQNKHRFYFLTIPVDDIFPYCFVTRRVEDPVEGFQRNLAPERAKAISAYLDNSEGSIPTNVVLSAQEDVDFEYDSKNKLVRFKRIAKGFLVIDGQHRLYGYGLTKKKHRVPISIYTSLSRQEEARLFIDINNTQRGVPASLLLDIKQVAALETTKDAFLRRLFDALNRTPDSPLNGLMSAAENVRGKINRVAFNRAWGGLIDNEAFTNLSEAKQGELLKNYLKALEANLNQPGLISRAVYFEAFAEIFDDVLKAAYRIHGNYKLDSLVKVLDPLQTVNLDQVNTKGRARLTKAAIVPILRNALFGMVVSSDELV